ncbi:MAG: hypothetical protein OEZ54_00385 [Gemmatimonadota bacterium]|nr:hypothetical protein [Gemmatimonadota bacterium]
MNDMRNRRQFLKSLAKGAVYAAPVVVTLAGPVTTSAQTSSHSKGQGTVMNPNLDVQPSPNAPGPWESNAPPGH